MDNNCYIKKSHIDAVKKFNEVLKAWAKETGETEPTLYENAYTSFTLSDPMVENGWLKFNYDGQPDSVNMVVQDKITGEYYEEDCLDSIMEYLKFWKACLRRAKRYWAMPSEKLDAIQEGNIEDDEEEED